MEPYTPHNANKKRHFCFTHSHYGSWMLHYRTTCANSIASDFKFIWYGAFFVFQGISGLCSDTQPMIPITVPRNTFLQIHKFRFKTRTLLQIEVYPSSFIDLMVVVGFFLARLFGNKRARVHEIFIRVFIIFVACAVCK